jgi:hypothetical protein
MPKYKHFQVRHPEYDARLWAKARAFYAGGEQLLGDHKLLAEVFPRHLAEEPEVYKERKARAFYVPYAGEILDAIVASLFGEPITVSVEEGVAEEDFYEAFFRDTSPPAGRKVSLNDLLKTQLLTALQCKRAWTLVDLPDVPPNQEPESLADEEALGLRDAYACEIEPEMVLDWEETEDGELLWALIMHTERKRSSLEDLRDTVTERYTHYTPESWQQYEVVYKVGKPPKANEEVPLLREGTHSFGRVPLHRLELSDGLWAMGKLLSIAIAHFNLRNALNWAECKALFPVLASFLSEEEVMNPATADPDRDVNQAYGQGRIARFGAKDDLRYVGPDTSAYKVAMEDLAGLRDEMHRVVHHMALSVENSAAALQRSAESKQVDQSATAVVLRALGQIVREATLGIYDLVARGRGEAGAVFKAEGMESFNEQSVDALMTQATTIDAISIPSATFKRIWTFILARRILGENATEEDFAAIRKELEANISNEDYLMPLLALHAASPEEEEPEEEESEEETAEA